MTMSVLKVCVLKNEVEVYDEAESCVEVEGRTCKTDGLTKLQDY